jgi:LCP family protein required for cell wall assembly
VPLRRTWPQRLILLFSVSLVATCVFAASSIAGLYATVGDIERIAISPGVLDARADDDPGGPRNILLIGTTENEGIDSNDDLLAGRANTRLADTLMLLRLEPAPGQAAVMSINRDLWVREGSYEGRINGAMQTGGVESLVKVVQKFLGVPVNNFAVVNFSGFRKVVDQVGGVPVYFEYPARDLGSFFEIDAGCHVLDGPTALNYVRSRKYQEYKDNKWRDDNGNDQRRAERQRDFLILMLDRVIQKGGRNPVTMRRLVEAATDGGAVTLDDLLTVKELIDLGQAFGGFSPENLQRYALPSTGYRTDAGADVLRFDEAEAQPILDIFRGLGNTLQPDQVNIQKVFDARGKVDEPAKPDKVLRDHGFTVVTNIRAAGGDPQPRTTLRYSPDQRNAALLLARYLGVRPNFVVDSGLKQLELTVGTDWAGVRDDPRPEEEFAGLVPGVPGASTTTAAPTTTARNGDPTTTTTAAPAEPEPESSGAGIIGRPPEGVSCN